ncbi:MAG: YbhB/YbcL family Raf kinase inhibitor-like protein [Pseudolabrys sp.]
MRKKNLMTPSCQIFSRIFALLIFTAIGTAAQAFELSSPDVGANIPFSNKFVFNGLGCKGENLSPALTWKYPPEGTKSFALMVHDPDAPTGGAGIWHWVVINIPATTTGLEQGAGTGDGAKLPSGAKQINNDYFGMTGNPGWGGPCPPKGAKAHDYNFTLYALKVETLKPPPTATASQVGFIINLNAIGKAKMTVPFGRTE